MFWLISHTHLTLDIVWTTMELLLWTNLSTVHRDLTFDCTCTCNTWTGTQRRRKDGSVGCWNLSFFVARSSSIDLQPFIIAPRSLPHIFRLYPYAIWSRKFPVFRPHRCSRFLRTSTMTSSTARRRCGRTSRFIRWVFFFNVFMLLFGIEFPFSNPEKNIYIFHSLQIHSRMLHTLYIYR